MKKQLSFLPKINKSHGGSLAVGKKRGLRPLNPRQSHHITLKSHHAVGGRCLFKHKKMIRFVLKKAADRFHVKVYEFALCSNHMHLVIKGPDRENIQNFFRVFAGHTAQNILKICPLPLRTTAGGSQMPGAGGAPAPILKRSGCRKNQRKFWSYLIFSRIVSWGREFKTVIRYVQKNTLEALNLIAYQPRNRKRNSIREGLLPPGEKVQIDSS